MEAEQGDGVSGEVQSGVLAKFGKKRNTDHDFPPPLKMWVGK